MKAYRFHTFQGDSVLGEKRVYAHHAEGVIDAACWWEGYAQEPALQFDWGAAASMAGRLAVAWCLFAMSGLQGCDTAQAQHTFAALLARIPDAWEIGTRELRGFVRCQGLLALLGAWTTTPRYPLPDWLREPSRS